MMAALVLLFIRTDCPISNRYAPEISGSARVITASQFRLVYRVRLTPRPWRATNEYGLATFRDRHRSCLLAKSQGDGDAGSSRVCRE
jgi:hypothetical protein